MVLLQNIQSINLFDAKLVKIEDKVSTSRGLIEKGIETSMKLTQRVAVTGRRHGMEIDLKFKMKNIDFFLKILKFWISAVSDVCVFGFGRV